MAKPGLLPTAASGLGPTSFHGAFQGHRSRLAARTRTRRPKRAVDEEGARRHETRISLRVAPREGRHVSGGSSRSPRFGT